MYSTQKQNNRCNNTSMMEYLRIVLLIKNEHNRKSNVKKHNVQRHQNFINFTLFHSKGIKNCNEIIKKTTDQKQINVIQNASKRH
jgi:hypothetical protein